MYFEMISENNYKYKKSLFPIDESRTIFLNEYLQFIDEAYYGKTKEIKDIENKIAEIREKYTTSQMKANTSKEKEELEKILCNAFGFTCCSIHIDPSSLYNAYTIPISSSVFDFRDFRNYIISNGEGIKYKKEANIYLIINVTKGLMFNSQFTDAEVTAIILHEIGHNFQTSMSGKCRYLNMINKTINLILAPIIILLNPQAGPFRNLYTDLIKTIEKQYKDAADCFWAINNFITSIGEFGLGALSFIGNISMMANPIAVIQKLPKQILSRLNLDTLQLFAGYKNEVVSDAFVSAYGYGSDLSSALTKIDKRSGGMVSDQIVRDMGILGAYFDLLCIPNKILNNIFDPHPNTIARLNNQYEYIHIELIKNEKNSTMKRELQKQLNEIEKSMDKFIDAEDSGFFFSNKLDKIMLMVFGGDIRNGMAKNINTDFDEAQNRAEMQLRSIKK